MNTFRPDLNLAALGDLYSLNRLVACLGRGILNLLDDIVALEHLAENDVSAIKPTMELISSLFVLPTMANIGNACLRGDDGGDEELRAVGVGTSVSHGEETLLGMLELEVLVLELCAIDCEGVAS